MRLAFEHLEIELVSGLEYYHTNQSWFVPAHSHPFFEAHFVTEGQGVNRVLNEQFEMYPGLIYLAPPNEVHCQWSDASPSMELYCFSFRLSGNPMADQVSRILTSLPVQADDLWDITLRQRSPSLGSRLRAQLDLVELLSCVVEPVLNAPLSSSTGPIPQAQRYLAAAVDYIRDHKMENPTVDHIAAACCISSRQLARVFSQTLQMSIHDYLQNERLSWAKSQLQNSSLSTSEISERLRFSSEQYFNRWFKHLTCISPAQFRLLKYNINSQT